MKQTGKNGYAFFDLDFTVIPHDTMLLFCNYVLQRERWRIFFLPVFLSTVPFAMLRLIGSRTMKRFFFSFLWRMPLERLERYAADFVESDVAKAIYPEMAAEIARHRSEGRFTILNTASPQIYIPHIAKRLGFDAWRSTQFRLTDPMPLLVTVEGPNNKRHAKLLSMASLLPEEISTRLKDEGGTAPLPVIPNSFAYSDSPADLPMLFLAESVVLIEPHSHRLIQVAEKRGWKILRLRFNLKPVMRYGRMVLQLFGLYYPSSK